MTAVRVEQLWKQYRYGRIGYGTLRHDLESWWARSRGRPDPNLRIAGAATEGAQGASRDRFWALEDVSFDVTSGEVVGIIGRNGAGKSTLLKVMSRVTAPTRGTVKLRGRLASLLEVGTGFHPDLTGRENIFLNGAILGMTRAEVRRKFDEIVGFSGLETFIDTPVKRYSSGMYVRLAFSVAAHLEPEILLVDEILAVGDSEFQARCLGKMEDVSRHGRTILFVSHNLQAVQNLCSRAILLAGGAVVADGPTETVIAEYLRVLGDDGRSATWESVEGLGNADVRLHRVAVKNAGVTQAGCSSAGILRTDSELEVEMTVALTRVLPGLCIGFDLGKAGGGTILRTYQTDADPDHLPRLQTGTNVLRCRVPAGFLNGGRYQLSPRLGVHNQEWIVHEDGLVSVRTLLSHGRSPYWNSLTEQNRPGDVAPILDWTIDTLPVDGSSE